MPARKLNTLNLIGVVIIMAAVFAWRTFVAEPTPPQADGACNDKFAYGRPVAEGEAANGTFLCRLAYAVLHDPDTKTPAYVANRLTRNDATGEAPREDDFKADPDLPQGERAELNDYRGSGYDRGHMAPAADFSDDPREMQESFYLSNMVPQNRVMNSGVWAGLEAATRACARSVGDVYVITGPIYGANPPTIGPSRVAIPEALYKIVLDARTGNARAFVMPNRALPRTRSYDKYETTIDDVQSRTGLRFFPQGNVKTDARGNLCADAFGS